MTEISERVAGWLRSTNLDPGATRQEAIVGAANQLVDDISGRGILDLILLAHEETSPEATRAVAEALRVHDETWAVRDGDREVVLTAAIAVAAALEDEPEVAIPFGLGVRSAKFCGLTPVVAELPDLAQAGLISASEQLRARHRLAAPTSDLKGIFTAISQRDAGETATTDDLKTLIKGIGTAFNRAVSVSAKLAPILDRRLGAAEEELNLLWWVFGEFSELADKSFKDVPDNSISCVAGIEMSSLLKERCPLPSTRSLLSRVLGSRASKSLDLAHAIPSTCKLVGGEWVPDDGGHRLLPVLSSAKEYLALEGKAAWKESVSRWGIDTEADFLGLDLSEQTINELLLTSTPVDADE